MSSITRDSAVSGSGQLHRTIDWRGAFWVASGVPALVLFSIGGIAGTTGKLAFLIWIVSMVMGFIQSFTYAEIAGLFPTSRAARRSTARPPGCATPSSSRRCRCGATGSPGRRCCRSAARSPRPTSSTRWRRSRGLRRHVARSRRLARRPANAGKTAADAIAALTAAGTPAIRNWTLYSGTLGPVSFSLNATFLIGVVLMLIIFAIQHRGILGTANVQKYHRPDRHRADADRRHRSDPHRPDRLGQLFAASCRSPQPTRPSPATGTSPAGRWSSAACSSRPGRPTPSRPSICYTSEFKNPGTDTFKAIFYSGLLCLLLYILVPFTFQGVLGLEGMLATPIVDGSGVADAMAAMVGGGRHHHLASWSC